MAIQAFDHDRKTKRLMSRHFVDMVAHLGDQGVHRGQATVLGEFQDGTKTA